MDQLRHRPYKPEVKGCHIQVFATQTEGTEAEKLMVVWAKFKSYNTLFHARKLLPSLMAVAGVTPFLIRSAVSTTAPSFTCVR